MKARSAAHRRNSRKHKPFLRKPNSKQVQIQRLLEEFSAALERETLYEQDILPRARKVAEQAERAFTLGASSLTDLLDARRTLRATLIEAAFTRADYAKAHEAWRLRTTVLSDPR